MLKPYTHITVGQFEDACNVQDVYLDYDLRIASMLIKHKNAREYAPEIADLLMRGRTNLASEIIEDPVYPEDNICVILRSLINASIQPPEIQPGILSSEASTFTDSRRCIEAEDVFALTLNELSSFNHGDSVNQGGEIFIDESGQAAILRKASGFSSAILLKKVFIGGIPMPIGSLLHLEAGDVLSGYNVLPRDRYRVRAASEITKIAIVRLSAFASDPAQREIGADSLKAVGEEANQLITNLKVEDMQPLVQRVLEMV